MKKTLFLLLILFIIGVIACKKDRITEGNFNGGSGNPGGVPNKPPIANAGPDLHFTGPGDNFLLDGSASTDPDGQIVEWQWTKISGPGNARIDFPHQKQTNVKLSFTGLFQFELKVEDNGGSTAKDTVNVFFFPPNSFCAPVSRPFIHSKLVPVWRFPFERFDMGVAVLGTKVYFAGGSDAWTGDPTSQVVILDMETKEETSASLSIARTSISCVTAGNKIFFAGGGTRAGTSTRMEIVDISMGSGKIAELSAPRQGMATAVLGNKVFFAGGSYWAAGDMFPSSRIDIYNMDTDTWSVSELSEARSHIAATVIGNKIYFAGGKQKSSASDAIDIYDAQTGAWSVSRLSTPAASLAAIAVNNKIYWAGGFNFGVDQSGNLSQLRRCQVEVKDLVSNSISSANLFKPVSSLVAAVRNNQIIFFPGAGDFSYFFDVYNVSTNSWSVGLINTGLRDGARFVYKNEIYVAGGYFGYYVGSDILNSQVMKLEF